MFSELFQSCRELAEVWFSVDRIRIAPTEGRLLQLKVGDQVVLMNQLYSVRQRRVESSSAGHEVVYRLGLLSEDRELRVHQSSGSDGNFGQLATATGWQTVFDSDVVVLEAEPLSLTESPVVC